MTETPPSRVRLTAQALIDELGIDETRINVAIANIVATENGAWGGYYDDKHDWTGDDEPNEDLVLEIGDDLETAKLADDLRGVLESHIEDVYDEEDDEPLAGVST